VTSSGGSVFVIDIEVNTCGNSDHFEWQRLVQFGQTPPSQRFIALPGNHLGAAWRFGAYGWAYGVSNEGAVFSISAAGAQRVEGIAARKAGSMQIRVAHNGRSTVALWDGLLLELWGTTGTTLARDVTDVADLAMDGQGRPLAIVNGSLRRYSRAIGWETLGGTDL
jgi:hypothetical protein